MAWTVSRTQESCLSSTAPLYGRLPERRKSRLTSSSRSTPAFSGNFKDVAFQCLEKVPTRNDRFTFAVDGHTFNYLVNDRVVYCVVATEAVGKTLPFGFLEKIKEEFLVRLDFPTAREEACPSAYNP